MANAKNFYKYAITLLLLGSSLSFAAESKQSVVASASKPQTSAELAPSLKADATTNEQERTLSEALGSIALRSVLYLAWCRAVNPQVDSINPENKWLQTAVGDLGKIIIAVANQDALKEDVKVVYKQLANTVKAIYSLATKKINKEKAAIKIKTA